MFKIKNFFFIFFILNYFTSFSLAENKIAYVNLDLIFSDSIPGKLFLKELKKLEDTNLDIFKKEEEALKNEENKLLSKKNIISKEEFDKGVKEFRKKVKTYQNKKIKLVENFKKKKNKEIIRFLNLINPLIEDVMNEKGIEIMLEKKNIFIAKSSNDITNIIIESINKNVKKFELEK